MSPLLHSIIVSVSFENVVGDIRRAKTLAVLTTKGVLRVNQLGAYEEIMIKLT